MKRKIGIIGGTGGMGSLFSRIFKEQGHEVLIASRRTELTIEECASTADIVILSVPIANTRDMITQIAPLIRKDSVFMDFTSIKKEEVELMMSHSQCEVIGCHPVFGPNLTDIKNQIIVLTPGRAEKWLDEIIDIFSATGAHIEISTPEKHDQIMAVVQGLVHFTSITFVNTLRKIKADPKEMLKFSSPVYRMRTDFAERILNQNPELYADIALLNPAIPEILQTYIETSKELCEDIKNKNREGFISQFKEASDYLGETKIEAEKRTDKIIAYCSTLKELN